MAILLLWRRGDWNSQLPDFCVVESEDEVINAGRCQLDEGQIQNDIDDHPLFKWTNFWTDVLNVRLLNRRAGEINAVGTPKYHGYGVLAPIFITIQKTESAKQERATER